MKQKKSGKILNGFCRGMVTPQVFPREFGGGMPYSRALARDIRQPFPAVADEEREYEDFETKRMRNEVSEEKLARRMGELQTMRAVWWIYTLGCLIAWIMAGVDIHIHGLDIDKGFVSMLLIILTPPLTGLFSVLLFRETFHLWQCQKRNLAGIGAFFADGGLMMMLIPWERQS